MSFSEGYSARRPSRAAAATALSAFLFAAGAAAGHYLAAFLLQSPDQTVSIHAQQLYAACDLAPDYAVRAAVYCTPIIWESALLLLAFYVPFEKALLSSLFLLRGIALGSALRFALLLNASDTLYPLLAAYACISLLYLALVYAQRIHHRRPFSEVLVLSMTVGGTACSILLLASALALH